MSLLSQMNTQLLLKESMALSILSVILIFTLFTYRIQSVHKFAKDIFLKRLSELSEIVINPIDYAKCIKLIKNDSDIMKVDFQSI